MTSFETSIPKISPRDIARVLFRRKAAILVFYASVILGATLFCFFWPPTYEAGVRFLVKHDREEPIISSDRESVRTISRQVVTEADLNTEMEILQSQTVLEQTARNLNLEKLPQHWALRLLNLPFQGVAHIYNWYHNRPNPDAFTTSVVRLRQKVFVIPQKKSSILEVYVQWNDPLFAAVILERLSDNYMAQHLAVTKRPDTQDFFPLQAEQKRQELDALEKKIEKIRPGATIDALRLQQDLYLRQIADFENQWRQTRTSRADAEAGVNAFDQELQNTPEHIVSEDRPLANDQALGLLKTRVLELRLRRTELLQKYLPSNRLVSENEKALKQAEDMLALEMSNPFKQQTTSINSVTQKLREDMSLDRSKIASLNALEEATKKELIGIDKQLNALNRDSLTIQKFERERRAAEAAYLQYLQRAEDARVEDEMNRRRLINVVPIEPVHPDYKPIKPNSKLILELALSVGLLLSLGFGFLLEHLDHRVKSERDIESFFAVPVLATFETLEEHFEPAYAFREGQKEERN